MRRLLPLVLLLGILSCYVSVLAQAPPQAGNSCINIAVAGGTADALTVPTLPCTPTSALLVLTTPLANATTAPTLSINGSLAQVILSATGNALTAGAFQPSGRYLLTYNGVNWFLISNGTSGVPFGTITGVVATNALLKAASVTGLTAGQSILRQGFAAAGDGGASFYVFSTSPCSSPDNGLQVAPNVGTGCWIAQLIGNVLDVRLYGVLPGAASDPQASLQVIAGVASGRTIFFPPGTYTCQSSTAAPFQPLIGAGCMIFNGQTNFKVLGPNATLTYANATNNANLIDIVSSSNFEVSGLHFLGNPTGLPANSQPSGIQFQYVNNFSAHDLWADGNWGGSTRFPTVLTGSVISDGNIYNIFGKTVSSCIDFAFVQRLQISNIIMTGQGDSSGPSNRACINFLHDAPTYVYYPAQVTDASNHDISLGPGIEATNFAAAIDVRTGRHYTIVGNNLHDNPGTGSVTDPVVGAGIIIDYSTVASNESVLDPPSDITIAGNVMAGNGSVAINGAGVVFGNANTQAFTTSGSGTIAAAGSSYIPQDLLTASGGTCQTEPEVFVNTVNGSGAVLTYTMYAQGMCSVLPSNPISFTGGHGSGFQLTASSLATPAMSGFTIVGNTFDNNNANAVAATGSGGAGTSLTNVEASGNITIGALQTNSYNPAVVSAFLRAQYQASPGNPTGTTQTTCKMMGLAGALTPLATGIGFFSIGGAVQNSTASDGWGLSLRYGTGTAPINGAAAAGTQLAFDGIANIPTEVPFQASGIATGMTVGTAYWFDLCLNAVTGGTASVFNVDMTASELR